ncbi:hypothetical protein QBC40DRAFT_278882 [Triangularia verruculosa]|uniref:FAD-binding FR-type domain-containing protein n=1 Tax=Triangularia verruculosa TaxID=2587418 RepID=A0AAN6XIW7_9PEZI|nr:hypothetical protein QBC40DRAFT_278882 [Triangularia verruculosa]
MATLQEKVKGWHDGERAVHTLLGVPTSSRENPTNVGLSWSHGDRVSVSPLIAIGTLDDRGRPWTSIWGGERNFARQISQDRLAIASLVDKAHDPVVKALGLDRLAESGLGQTSGNKAISALSIDLESRDRVKLAGKVVVGTLVTKADSKTIAQVQIGFQVEESLGNCPKYLNKKTIRAHLLSPKVVSTNLPLPEQAISLLAKADLFFLSSTNGQTMDTNHRGGPPGFMRVISNTDPLTVDGSGVVLIYPEYSGNRLYQTLGNLHTNPLIGIAVPNFDTSDVLYLTGTTQLLVGDSAAAYLPHTKLAVKITVHSAIFVRDGLSFRGTPGEFSPYNPPLRRLTSEAPAPLSASKPTATAALISKTVLSSTISRFAFSLSFPDSKAKKLWNPGQHITFDFSAELDNGWAHMNNSDPQSLNDDYVRTFTISNPPPASGEGEIRFEITARKHGPVTGFLWGYNISPSAAKLEIPVLGFGGEDNFRVLNTLQKDANKKAVFVAGGVGITPFLGQVDEIASFGGERVELIWSLRTDDLSCARDVLERYEGFKETKVRLFVTGDCADLGSEELDKIRGFEGVSVERRRLTKRDVLGDGFEKERKKYFLCAGVGMMKVLKEWLGGEEVVSESFEY